MGVKHVLSESKPLQLLFSSSAVGVISAIIGISVKDTVLDSPPALGMRLPELSLWKESSARAVIHAWVQDELWIVHGMNYIHL